MSYTSPLPPASLSPTSSHFHTGNLCLIAKVWTTWLKSLESINVSPPHPAYPALTGSFSVCCKHPVAAHERRRFIIFSLLGTDEINELKTVLVSCPVSADSTATGGVCGQLPETRVQPSSYSTLVCTAVVIVHLLNKGS